MILAYFFILITTVFGGILLAWMLTVVLDRMLMIKEEPFPILDMCLDCGLDYQVCECCGE
jgi:hypothetical protein